MSYEAGVLWLPPTFGQETFLAAPFKNRRPGAKEFPLHYDLPLTPYARCLPRLLLPLLLLLLLPWLLLSNLPQGSETLGHGGNAGLEPTRGLYYCDVKLFPVKLNS